MAKSKAATVDEYLAELPDDRRAAIAAVREVVLRNLPAGYEEANVIREAQVLTTVVGGKVSFTGRSQP